MVNLVACGMTLGHAGERRCSNARKRSEPAILRRPDYRRALCEPVSLNNRSGWMTDESAQRYDTQVSVDQAGRKSETTLGITGLHFEIGTFPGAAPGQRREPATAMRRAR